MQFLRPPFCQHFSLMAEDSGRHDVFPLNPIGAVLLSACLIAVSTGAKLTHPTG